MMALGIVLCVMCSGCEVDTSANVTHGSGPSKELSGNLRPFDLTLPADASDGHWIQAVDWDSQELYVRFRTTREGLAEMLRRCDISREAAGGQGITQPIDVLPKSSNYAKQFPRKYILWTPDPKGESRILTDGSRTQCGYVDVLADSSETPEVFLHLIDF